MRTGTVNNLRIFIAESREELVDFAFESKSLLIAVNAEKILHANQRLRAMINRNLGYPDGVGATMALRRQGFGKVEKIPGCELWLDIVQSHYRDKSFYLVGSEKQVVDHVVSRLRSDYPGIRIVNFRDGYLRDERERFALLEDVARTKPDVVFVAMGSPRQEVLMEEMKARHPAVYMGLGGSFDVYTGRVRRAPDWWVRSNLEWMYRLLQEPRRLGRQIHLLRFFFRLVLGRV